MANILILDDNEIACRALKGILTRGNHRCLSVSTDEEALGAIREQVKVDLLIVEPRRAGDSGLGLLEQLRTDVLLKNLPVLIYTQANEPRLIHRALELQVLNFLIKPYQDDALFKEVAKASKIPWRSMHFEETRSFCVQMGFSPDALKKMRDELAVQLEAVAAELNASEAATKYNTARSQLELLARSAEAAGVWAAVEVANLLMEKADSGEWPAFTQAIPQLRYVRLLIFDQLNPNHIPNGFLSLQERQSQEDERESVMWLRADVDCNRPLVEWETVKQQLDKLPYCPVVDSAAANFQMAATQKTGNLGNLMDLVSKDSGLATSVLIAANQLNVVEDPKLAISQLGDVRINSLAQSVPTIEERRFFLPPLTWSNYWKFQVGVARLALYACQYLEFFAMSNRAYTAGLLHDIGKLLLVKLYPHGFHAMQNYSRRGNVPLMVAEQKYIGCTTWEIGAYFAEKRGLPQVYRNVIQFVECPDRATEDVDLVAVISLARFLCMHNHVGISGDLPKDICPPIEQTPAWQVLQSRVFLSFNLSRFEAQIHAHCQQVRQELMGKDQQ